MGRKHGYRRLPHGIVADVEAELFYAVLPSSALRSAVEGPRRRSPLKAEADLVKLMDATTHGGNDGLRSALVAMEIEQFSEDLGCPWHSG